MLVREFQPIGNPVQFQPSRARCTDVHIVLVKRIEAAQSLWSLLMVLSFWYTLLRPCTQYRLADCQLIERSTTLLFAEDNRAFFVIPIPDRP